MGWPCKPDAIWVLRRQVEYPRAGFFYRPWLFRKMQWKVDQEIVDLLRRSPSSELRDFLLAAATGQEVPLKEDDADEEMDDADEEDDAAAR